MITSSTSAGSSLARSIACLTACPPIVAPWVMLSAPRQDLQSGVRAVETITASVMGLSFVGGDTRVRRATEFDERRTCRRCRAAFVRTHVVVFVKEKHIETGAVIAELGAVYMTTARAQVPRCSTRRRGWQSLHQHEPPPGAIDRSRPAKMRANFLAEFTGGWRWAPAGAQVVVGVAGFIDAAGTNAGESSFSDPTSSGSFKLKQTNRYGISVDVGPNWRTMPYGKITYAWSRFEGELNASGCNSVSGAQTTSGWGFGAGVRHLQTANLYFFAEVLYQDYGNERFNQTLTCGGVVQAPANLDFSASNLIGLIGAGWKF